MISKTHLPNYSKQVSQLNLSNSLSWSKLILRLVILVSIPFALLTSCKSYGHNSFFKLKDSIPIAPFWYPIDVTKKGTKLEVIVRVKKPDTYGFYLCFYTNRPEYQNRKREFGEYGPAGFSFWDGVMSFFPTKILPLTQEQSEYNDRLSEMMFGHKHGHAFVNGRLDETKKVFTPVKIQLFSNDGTKRPLWYFNEKTMQGEHVPDEGIEPQLNSWGESYDKTIGSTGLMLGVYKIIIETLKDTPELKGFKVEFGFHTDIRHK
jgi:hypothetical protein